MADGQAPLGIYVLADAPFPALRERWRLAEELGFDVMYVAGHAGPGPAAPAALAVAGQSPAL